MVVIVKTILLRQNLLHILLGGEQVLQNGGGVLEFLNEVEEDHAIRFAHVGLVSLQPLAKPGGPLVNRERARVVLREDGNRRNLTKYTYFFSIAQLRNRLLESWRTPKTRW